MIEGYGYIGQAGTGKTTLLISKVEDAIDIESWPKSASVLAITFMHGSRRRLENKLKSIQKKGIRVNCQTIDSFCLNILQHYKSYVAVNQAIVVSDHPDDYHSFEKKIYAGINVIRNIANDLLSFTVIRNIMGFSYPIVVVDEFQDCDGALLTVIQKLSGCCRLFVAADDFQKLDNSTTCVATEWLSKTLHVVLLDQIWRTDNANILDSAKALRSNVPTTNGVEVKFAPSRDLAAYFILSNMHWYSRMGSNGRTVAIISPVGPQSDYFVRSTLERLNTPMKGNRKRPYKLEARPFQVENEKQIISEDIFATLKNWDSIDVVTLDLINEWSDKMHLGLEIAEKRAKKLMKLRNASQISKIEFSELVSSGIHFASTFITKRGNSRIFLTVHGAKNREFDDVFILWPQYTLPSDSDLYLRKLMYNAITRAKRKVVIIVQGQEQRGTELPLNLIKTLI